VMGVTCHRQACCGVAVTRCCFLLCPLGAFPELGKLEPHRQGPGSELKRPEDMPHCMDSHGIAKPPCIAVLVEVCALDHPRQWSLAALTMMPARLAASHGSGTRLSRAPVSNSTMFSNPQE
jgi:hypothetical protein